VDLLESIHLVSCAALLTLKWRREDDTESRRREGMRSDTTRGMKVGRQGKE
jgi:hypothetical protein